MKKQIGFFMLATALAVSAYAQSSNTTVLPFQDLSENVQGQVLRWQIDGVPAMSSPSYAYAATPTLETKFILQPGAGDPFAAPPVLPNAYFSLIPVYFVGSDGPGTLDPVTPEHLILELGHGIGWPQGTTLWVGFDGNSDGKPQKSELLCTIQVSAAIGEASCLVDIPPAPGFGDPRWLPIQGGVQFTENLWVMVQAPSNMSSPQWMGQLDYGVINAFDDPLPPDATYFTGPGHIDAGVSQPFRLTVPSASSGIRSGLWLGIARIDQWTTPQGPGYGALLARALTPISFTVASDQSDPITMIAPTGYGSVQPLMNSPGFIANVVVAPGRTLRHLYFDIPPTTDGSQYDQVNAYPYFNGQRIPDGVDAYLIRTDFPEQSASAIFAAAPAPDASAIHFTSGYVSILTPTAGRWYVVVTNSSNSAVSGNIWVNCNNNNDCRPLLGAGANPTIHPGVYYNVQRSGHGVTISQVAGQQMLYWYTYLEDGTPTWYVAQATAPNANSGWWQAPLFRASWNGSKARLTQVGSVNVTPIAQNRFTFNWNLEGQYGSEVMAQIARFGDCPALNGVATNLNGAWYAPALSGYGMDVLALPEQQFNIFYFYDNLGLARWGVGGAGSFILSGPQEFSQISGFCPSCAYVKTQSQSLGTANVSYASDSTGHLSTNFVLKAPLSGTWNTDQTMQRLTGSSACTQ